MSDDATTRVHDVWNRMASGWTRDTAQLWEASREVGRWMVDRLDPQPGDVVLELAAGTGDTGFLAAQRVGPSGKVICSDFVEAMVEGARARGAEHGLGNVEYRVIDAQAIDLPADGVDGVLCRWGYMLMPDPALALQETRRVLKPGGRLAFSVWARPESNPWATIVGHTLTQMGHPPTTDPFGPGGVFSMSDADRARELVEGAGFDEIVLEEVAMTWSFADFGAIWTFLTEVAGAVAVMILALPDDRRARFRTELEKAVEPFRGTDGYAVPGMCLNVLAS